jgi:hypothetical protein
MTPQRFLSVPAREHERCVRLYGLVLAATLLGAPLAQAAQTEQLEPAVRTSTAATPVTAVPDAGQAPAAQASGAPTHAAAEPLAPPRSSATPAAAAPGAAIAGASGAHAKDHVELDTTQITGNRELPNVMYVVPWKRPELGDFSGRPPRSLLDELLAPVDREVFQRQNRYYTALRPDAAAGQRAGGSGGAASPHGDRNGEGKGDGTAPLPAGQNAADER